MKKNNKSSPDDFDSFFKDKLRGGHMEPSAGLWDKIESELEEEKKPSLLFPGLGALILLALGVSVGVYFFGSKTKDAKRDQIIAQAEKRNSERQAVDAGDLNSDQKTADPIGVPATEEQQSSPATETSIQPSTTSASKTIKPENKTNEQKLYATTNSKQETTTTSAKPVSPAETVNPSDQNSVAEIPVAKPTVKSENATNVSEKEAEKEKSNRVEKALPVLGTTITKKTNDEAKVNPTKNNEAVTPDQNKQENSIAAEEKKQSEKNVINPESKMPSEEKKKEEEVKEEVAKQSDLPAKVHQPDSLPVDDYGKLAINVGIGFNQIMPNSVSTMGSTEKYLTSFGDEFKVQYRPCKFVSLNVGAGYSFYKIQRDATDFSFDRNMGGDYVFNTTIGNISMNHLTLLEGYDSNKSEILNGKYSYFSQIDFINVPIEVQAHFVNRKKFRMWSGVGVNGSYILSQNTRFTVTKESTSQNYNYSDVFLKKTNAYLTLSLGCDIKFRDKMFFYISPSYRYGLTNMSQGTGLTFKPQALMGIVGVKFILK